MCGLSGWLSWGRPPDINVVARMNAAIAHRGPDADGLEIFGPVVLGHRRLSIIDLSVEANQPMVDPTRRCALVYNGEIYNFLELRRELEAKGARFLTSGDTEVLLQSYLYWGLNCVTKFNGMFAFALWDAQEQMLLLARDRLGEKPLYYADDGAGGCIFASEPKALRQHPSFRREIDLTGLGQYLAFNYTIEDKTLLTGIHKLPAAHMLVLRRNVAPRLTRYWDLAPHFLDKERHRSEANAAAELSARIDEAVRLRLVADVPVGAFLSGGIDSSAIVASMCQVAARDRVKTFSIGFNESGFDETPYARQAAGFLGVDHHERIADVDVANDLRRIMHFADEPLADSSLIPTFHLARFARETVTVALSGDGGDEIFGGYETYAADRLRNSTAVLPARLSRSLAMLADKALPHSFGKVGADEKLRRFLRGHCHDADRAHSAWRQIFHEEALPGLLQPEHLTEIIAAAPLDMAAKHAAELADAHYLDRAMYIDIKTWLPDDILTKVDRATMAHGLESRAPLLDHTLVEFAASLPVNWKLRGFSKKYLFSRSQRDRLPSTILNRRKRGFNAPVSHWLTGGLRDLARSATRDRFLASWFQPKAIDRLWADHESGRRDRGLELFGLTCLSLWLQDINNTTVSP